MKGWIAQHGYWMKIPVIMNLGMLFIVAGVGKLFYQSSSFAAAPFIETLPGGMLFYTALPYIEIVIGSLLVIGLLVKFAAASAGVLIIMFASSSLYLVSIGKGFDLCGCFGMAGRLNYISALGLDVVMAGMVAIIFICHRGGYFNMTPWYLDDNKILAKQQA